MSRKTGGYTIIEVMLFLAVSGALAAGILVSVGSTIGAQRYRDAVDSFAAFIQGQYDKTTNVQNDIEVHEKCKRSGSGNGVAVVFGDEVVPAGTSESCMIVGRVVTTSNGKEFIARPLYLWSSNEDLTEAFSGVGDYEFLETAANGNSLSASKVAFVSAYSGDDDLAVDRYTLNWDTQVRGGASSQVRTIVILRSPVSGVIHTYSSESAGESLSLASTVNSARRKQPTKMCVDASGWLVPEERAVSIGADASLASAVQVGGCE